MKKKERLEKIVYALNGFLFLLGTITLISDTKLIYGIIQLIAALLNFSMIVKFRNSKTEQKMHYAVLGMNVIVCCSIFIDHIQSGKKYIQYVWLLAAVASLIALFIKKVKLIN